MKKQSLQKLSFRKQVINNLSQQVKGGEAPSWNSCWCVPSDNSCGWDCPISLDSCWCLPTNQGTCLCLPTFMQDCSRESYCVCSEQHTCYCA